MNKTNPLESARDCASRLHHLKIATRGLPRTYASVVERYRERVDAVSEQIARCSPEMTLERAIEISDACCMHNFAAQGFVEGDHPLPDCSLEEMLTAGKIVQAENAAERRAVRANGGSYSLRTTVADRGLAAAFALKHYGGPEQLLEAVGFQITNGRRGRE